MQPLTRAHERRLIATALAGLAGLALAIGLGRFSYTAVLPMMQADQGLSLSAGSVLAFANLLGYLIGGLTASRFRDQAVGCLRFAMIVVVVSLALMAVTEGVWWWSLWRLIAGVGSAWVMVMISILCLPLLNPRPNLAGWVYSGVGTGIFLGGLVCLLLVLFELSAMWAWWVLALICGLLAWFVWRQLAPPISSVVADPKPDTAPVTAPVTTPNNVQTKPVDERRLWKLIVCYGLYGFGYILPATYLPAQARLLLQDHWIYGVAWPVFGLAALLSTGFAASLANRLGALPTWTLAHVLMALGVLVPIVFPELLGIVLAALAVGGTFVVITLLAMQQAHQYGGSQAPLWMARLTTAFAAGQILGPLAVIFLQERLTLSLTVAAVVLLGTAGILFQQWRLDEKNPLLADKPDALG